MENAAMVDNPVPPRPTPNVPDVIFDAARLGISAATNAPCVAAVTWPYASTVKDLMTWFAVVNVRAVAVGCVHEPNTRSEEDKSALKALFASTPKVRPVTWANRCNVTSYWVLERNFELSVAAISQSFTRVSGKRCSMYC